MDINIGKNSNVTENHSAINQYFNDTTEAVFLQEDLYKRDTNKRVPFITNHFPCNHINPFSLA